VTIQAKIARVINEKEIAFNKGLNDGVAEGDIATVRETLEVLDPDSGEVLGSVSVVKVRLDIFLVMEKISVGRVTDRARRPGSDEGLLLNVALLSNTVTKQVTEERDLADWRTVHVEKGQLVWIDSPPKKEAEDEDESPD